MPPTGGFRESLPTEVYEMSLSYAQHAALLDSEIEAYYAEQDALTDLAVRHADRPGKVRALELDEVTFADVLNYKSNAWRG